MAVPKQKHTKSRRDKRRMHIYLKSVNLSLCEKCGKEKEMHKICWECGFYKGKEIIDVLAKIEKKEKNRKSKGEK